MSARTFGNMVCKGSIPGCTNLLLPNSCSQINVRSKKPEASPISMSRLIQLSYLQTLRILYKTTQKQ